MATQTINISLPRELVRATDKMARRTFQNRSELIRRAVREHLADELQDGRQWETVVDFTLFRRDGIPAREVLARLKRLDGSYR